MSKEMYLHVGVEWSYNFIGGIVVDYDLSEEDIDHLYVVAAEYITVKHNGTNSFAAIRKQLEHYAIGVDYCMYYYKQLFELLKVSLQVVTMSISKITPIVQNKSSDLDGFLIHVN